MTDNKAPNQASQQNTNQQNKPAWLSFEYWLGQILVIVATIVGVYLAAVVGFEQAIDFEVFNEYMDEYDVATSFYEEAMANATYIEAQANKRLAEPKSVKLALPPLALNQFVWKTMQYNPQTFELSAATINAAQRYYANITKGYKSINSFYDYETTAAAKKLLQRTADFRVEVLQPLAERIEFLEGKLAEYDTEIVQ